MSESEGAKIVGPFNERRLVVGGWTVPLIQAGELDGGKIHFTLDHRFGLDIEAKDFEPVAAFLADTIAVALGLPSHPREDLDLEATQRMWALLPHTSLAPTRLKELGGIQEDEGESGRADK